MATLFTRIVNREIPAHLIAEDEKHLAFLDINPLVPGHTLAIPKAEVDYIFDLNDEQLAALMVFSRKVAAAIRKAIPCRRVGIEVIGLEVPHAHVHLIPLNKMSDMNFSGSKLSPSQEELAATADKIRKAF